MRDYPSNDPHLLIHHTSQGKHVVKHPVEGVPPQHILHVTPGSSKGLPLGRAKDLVGGCDSSRETRVIC
jgi:hypothetical protein